MKLRIIVIALFLFGKSLASLEDKVFVNPKAKSTFDSLVGKAKSAWSGAGNMLEGMGQGFGYVGKGYKYSYRVFNDASSSVFVATEQLTELLGASFRGQIQNIAILGPNANTDEAFYNQQLYLTVWIDGDTKQKDLNKYSRTANNYLQKYGGIAGKAHITGKGIWKIPAGFVNVNTIILGTLGKDLGAIASGIIDIVKGLVKAGLKAIQKVTGLDVGADKLSEPLDRYKLLSKIIYPWQENDDKVYYYRSYSRQGELKAEYLDLAGTTSEFSGQFYNHSTKNIPLQFTKDGNPYTVTLEPNSFNLLESSKDVDFSIRPSQGDETRGFHFYNDTVSKQSQIAFIPISADGIGNVTSKSKNQKGPLKKSDLVVVGPKLYTYEIYDSSEGPAVGVQGLKIGNFDQPSTGGVRDINPAVCHLWYKNAKTAAAEMQKEQQKSGKTPTYNAIPFDVPEQVWINYKSSDYTLQEKVLTGSAVDFYLLRPQIKEKSGAWLYIVSLQTNDEVKAKKFLDRLSAGNIGAKAIFTDVTKEELDKKRLLAMKPNVNGFIVDDQGAGASGVTGAVLLTDWFGAQGVGSGPFYYELDPSLLRIDQFASVIWFDKKFYDENAKTGGLAIKTSVMKELSENLPKWILQYQTDQDGAKAALKKYLLQKGNAGQGTKESSGIFVDATVAPEQRQFTEQGKELYQTLIDGPISLKNFPIMRKAGNNWYTRTLGDKPKNWPK